MSIKELVVGGVITLTIGGSAYSFSQADVATNLAEDTGMTQQEAEQYVGQVQEEDLVSYNEVATSYIDSGQEFINYAAEIDCVNYEYGWESTALTCAAGKYQLEKIGRDEVALGESYRILDTSTASTSEIRNTVRLLDLANSNYKFEILSNLYDPAAIEEFSNTNSYNKAILNSALESD